MPSRLSQQWLCGNSCTWAHDARLHHDAQSLQMLQEVLPTVDQHFPPLTKFYEIFNKNRNNVEEILANHKITNRLILATIMSIYATLEKRRLFIEDEKCRTEKKNYKFHIWSP